MYVFICLVARKKSTCFQKFKSSSNVFYARELAAKWLVKYKINVKYYNYYNFYVSGSSRNLYVC